MKKFLKSFSLVCALFGGLLFAACSPQAQASLPEEPEEQTFPQNTTPEENLPEEPTLPEPEERAPEEKKEKIQYISISVEGLNIRTGAGTDYPVLGQAERGTLLKFVERNGNWYETTYRGRQAFVSADGRYSELITLDPADDKTEKVISTGEKYLGTPYVYGAVRLHDGKGHLLKGFTTEKFDCSSLMQYIFYGENVLLDVTTRTQIKQGVHVAKEDIRRGDLLFFTNASRYSNTGIERVGHVALYLGGNYILHTASDYAKIEQITAQRQRYFLEARRML